MENKWHSYSLDAIFKKLQTSPNGLDENEAKKRLSQYGPNSIHLEPPIKPLKILIRQLHNPIVYTLIFSTFFSLIIGKFIDSFIIFAVIILNTLIGFIQEYKAYKIIKSLSKLTPEHVTVKRNGVEKSSDPSLLVPGDIVSLQAGDRIPSDIRLLTTKNLQCDESMLTGESLPVSKDIYPTPEDTLLAERECMAFMGTHLTSGTAIGIVVETGLKTEFGKISTLIGEVHSLETPLSFNLKKIALSIALGVFSISIALFLIGYFRGNTFFDAIFSAITLAVAAIPEGLPAIFTIASSVGLRKMAKKHAIIRRLPAVEALGSTTIICTDKTGTLTYNEMEVQKIWTQLGFSCVSEISQPEEEISNLFIAATLCNNAFLNDSSNNSTNTCDPTELALIQAAKKIGLEPIELRKNWPRKNSVPFESEKRIMVTLNSSDSHYFFIKGAPEDILSRCIDSDINIVKKHVHNMAEEGMRVLAIAKKKIEEIPETICEKAIENDFELLGLVGMIDPPRKEVYEALKKCKAAGITVKMITGDHPITAKSIGKDLGILGEGKVISGKEMNSFGEEEWHQAVNRHHIFARATPEHKLKIVKVLQESGHVIAMTGDGINDAAALKQADIGIAMGIKGSSVAKESSDMVLVDDNFASIEKAIEEGRCVYDNLIKSIIFLIPTNLGQALVILIAVLFFPIQEGNLLHPIQPIQILWVNLIVAICLSLPLAFEPAEKDIMKLPPRKKKESILSRFLLFKTFIIGLLISGGTIGLFLWKYQIEIAHGHGYVTALAKAQTMAVTAIILFQMFYLFQCRSLRTPIKKNFFITNHFISLGVATVLLFQIAFIYSPFMNTLFSTASLNAESWVIMLVVTFFIIPAGMLLNFIQKSIS
jgi:calcium-translocating P-type ATPase